MCNRNTNKHEEKVNGRGVKEKEQKQDEKIKNEEFKICGGDNKG